MGILTQQTIDHAVEAFNIVVRAASSAVMLASILGIAAALHSFIGLAAGWMHVGDETQLALSIGGASIVALTVLGSVLGHVRHSLIPERKAKN